MAHPDDSTESLHLITDDAMLVGAPLIHDFFDAKLTGRSTVVSPRGLPVAASDSTVAASKAVAAVGVNYHVVGIFGGQSSGKSTLLNYVFGTDFKTMDSQGGQHQTTKGAFLNKSSRGSNLFIVDFEGTDGVERGEDQSFERQLSLFALSITDTLIVNMWAKDVGRYNAANMALLRIVFEVNLQLFSHNVDDDKSKPTLLFVLRDYTKKSKLPADIEVLTASLEKIWETITKPERHAHLKLQDMFKLDFFPLSHFELQEEQFRDDCKLLQRRFVDKHDEDYIFASDDNLRRIPLEGLPMYLSSCWKAIKESKDIDIPSQRELLARCRCSELFDQEVASFADFCAKLADKIKHGDLTENITAAVDARVQESVEKLRAGGKLYSTKVVAEFQEKLSEHLEQEGLHVIEQQCGMLAGQVLSAIEKDILGVVDDALKLITRNKLILNAAASGSDGGAMLPDANQFVKDFWRAVHHGVTRLTKKLQDTAAADPGALFGRHSNIVARDPLCRERSIALARSGIIDAIRKRMEALATECVTHMHKVFEEVLNHNADGTVRYFATSKGLRHAFGPARFAGLLLMACLLYFRIDREDASADGGKLRAAVAGGEVLVENDDEQRFYLGVGRIADGWTEPSYPKLHATDDGAAGTGVTKIDPAKILMSPEIIKRHYDFYVQQCNYTLTFQERTIEASKQQIPIAMWALLAFFGFNEIYWLLTNPLMLLLAVVLGYVFFKQWLVAQWQRFEETGPAQVVMPLKMLFASLEPYAQHVDKLLTPAANADAPAAAATASSSSTAAASSAASKGISDKL